MDPSLLQQCKKADYSVVHNDSDLSLLVVEAKSYKANSKCKVDLVKMAKYMKEELQEAEKCGNAGVRLIGIIFKGKFFSILLLSCFLLINFKDIKWKHTYFSTCLWKVQS